MITKYDESERRCPALGHQIRFHYCRTGHGNTLCKKIQSCWYDRFSVREFITHNYTTDEILKINTPPKPKILSLVELIENARRES